MALGAEFREAAPSKHHLAQATKNCHGRKGQGPSKEEKRQRQKDEEPKGVHGLNDTPKGVTRSSQSLFAIIFIYSPRGAVTAVRAHE